jgi:hypothetical protein
LGDYYIRIVATKTELFQYDRQMISGSHTGEWFLPGKKKFPGQLVIDSEKETIHLEIYGHCYIDEISFGLDSYPEHFHTVILGAEPVCTLYNCHLCGSKEVGTNLSCITYRIEYVFTGFHFKDPQLSVRGGRFTYSHLATWFDGSEFLAKLEGSHSLRIGGEVHQMPQNALRRDEVKLNSELTMVFWDEVNKHTEQINISYRIQYHKYVQFQYEVNVPFHRLLTDAITFLKLLSFSFGKPMNLFIIYIVADKTEVIGPEETDPFGRSGKELIHVNNYTLKRGNKISEHWYHSRDLAVSRHTLSREELNHVMLRWFDNKKLYGIYEYYLDSNNWFQDAKVNLTNVMFNNRFLNLIQGLEAYFNEFYPTKVPVAQNEQQMFDRNKNAVMNLIVDPSLKDWCKKALKPPKARELSLKEKLAILIDDLKPDIEQVFRDVSLNEFAASASGFRNLLSHGENQDINLGVRLHEEFYIAQVLLGACILRSLGVGKLNERIGYYSRFADAAYQIYHFQLMRSKSL